jgi:glyoxylase-like metal-dependent hydrolase (beta-lactamase superfamily II)
MAASRLGVRLTVRLGASNVYLLDAGDGLVSVDAGPDYQGAWESVLEQTAAAGLDHRNVGAVLVTHGHPDHCALAAAWQREAGAEVWAAPAEVPKLEAGGRDADPARAAILDALVTHGVPPDLVAAVRPARRESDRTSGELNRPQRDLRLQNLRSVAAEHGEWPAPLRATPAQADRLIAEGSPISLGGLRLQPILCPGHTPASTVFLNDTTGDLYTGDHVLERIVPTPGIQVDAGGRRIRSLPQYLRSLEAVRNLAPRGVLPGHGEPFTDLAGAVDRITAVIEQRAGRLQRRLAGGSPATAWELAHRLYPHLRPSAIWVVMAEVIGLLDVLEEQGEVVRDDAEVMRYTRET